MDKATLLGPRAATGSGFPEDDVDVAGLGSVRVRGLSRVEAILVQKLTDEETRERRILHLGLVDPVLSEHECGDWMRAAVAGEIEPVSLRIAELSGLTPTAAKEAYRGFEANPEAEFQSLPGAEAGDDGGSTPSGDE